MKKLEKFLPFVEWSLLIAMAVYLYMVLGQTIRQMTPEAIQELGILLKSEDGKHIYRMMALWGLIFALASLMCVKLVYFVSNIVEWLNRKNGKRRAAG